MKYLLSLLVALLLLALLMRVLPLFLIVIHRPDLADAIIVLGGDGDGSRLRMGVKLFDQGLAARLVLTGGKKQKWHEVAQKYCPDCRLQERSVDYLLNSIDTRTDAKLTLAYCRVHKLQKILVVTSPYHTRRAQFVFNDICQENGIKVTVITSGDFGKLTPPNNFWWMDERTAKTVVEEFAKILYWELTPFEQLDIK